MKELIGTKFIYVGSDIMPNIPFNIIGDGELPERLKVQTWEGRGHTGKLMGKFVGDWKISAIKEMINDKKLIKK
jgi:hypothetical protein